MSSEVKTLIQSTTLAENKSLFEKAKPHAELIAALLSGVLIAAGWILDKNELAAASITTYIIAFIIGGFAKAKEGIEETIANKELNVEMLMIFAAIGSCIIGYWTEGAILIFIFAVSGAMETYTMNKSHKEISALMELQPEQALRINDGFEEKIHVSELEIGDFILVKPGERIPSDGKIAKGHTTIDEAAITGESIPVSKEKEDAVFAGTVNLNGSITIEITKPNSETLFQKIILLVQSAQSEKSPSQLFIEKFEGTYVKVILTIVVLMMFLPHYLLGWSWMETFYRAMILLVVASPCALVASIMPATLSAISNGARHGILFKGGVHLENLSHLKAIAFDKTGTLTKGKPEVTDIIAADGVSGEEVLLVAASIESHSTHPLANAIVHYAKKTIDKAFITPERMEDVPGWGVKATIVEDEWKIGKASFVGLDAAENFSNGALEKMANQGKTVVFVQKNDEIAALIALQDVVREETKKAIDQLKNQGIYTIMLTGDSQKTGKAIDGAQAIRGTKDEAFRSDD